MKINGHDANGKKHGIWKLWNNRHNVLTMEYYFHGILDGPAQAITKSGYMKKEEYYCNGKKHGKWTLWKWTNTPYSQTHYHNGKQVGLTRIWQEAPTCGGYDEDCECDNCGCCQYSDCGSSECSDYSIREYDNPQIFTLQAIGYIHNEKKEGIFQEFNKYSQLSLQKSYKDGKEHSKIIQYEYYSDTYSYAHYNKGVQQGLEVIWDTNGFIKECYYYVNGKKEGLVQNMAGHIYAGIYDTRYDDHGLYRIWDRDGNIQRIVYRNFRCTNGLDQTFHEFRLLQETTNVVPNAILEKYPHLVQKLYGVDFI